VFMKEVNSGTVSSLFNLPLKQEKELTPGVYIYEWSKLKGLIERITDVLRETGAILEAQGYYMLYELIFDVCQPGKPATAVNLIEALVKYIPAFRDITQTSNGETVFILKKAQLLAAELYRRFHSEDIRFRFEDINELTIFADNVIPTMLRALGILEYESSLAERIDQDDLLNSEEHLDLQLRAISISICEDLVIKMRHYKNEYLNTYEWKELRDIELDYYLWRLGKDPRYRSLKRHRTQDTIYY
jgi:hypothetical protein